MVVKSVKFELVIIHWQKSEYLGANECTKHHRNCDIKLIIGPTWSLSTKKSCGLPPRQRYIFIIRSGAVSLSAANSLSFRLISNTAQYPSSFPCHKVHDYRFVVCRQTKQELTQGHQFIEIKQKNISATWDLDEEGL